MIRFVFFFLTLISSLSAFAHCPGHFEAENVCFMLDQNLVYIYHQKFEHNGPYQDLKNFKILTIKNAGKTLEFSKKARGIIEIKSDKSLVEIEIEIANEKIKKVLKLKRD